MISDKLRRDIDFKARVIRHTKKTLEKPAIHPYTKTLLINQLKVLEFEFAQLLEQLPKKKVNAPPTV